MFAETLLYDYIETGLFAFVFFFRLCKIMGKPGLGRSAYYLNDPEKVITLEKATFIHGYDKWTWRCCFAHTIEFTLLKAYRWNYFNDFIFFVTTSHSFSKMPSNKLTPESVSQLFKFICIFLNYTVNMIVAIMVTACHILVSFKVLEKRSDEKHHNALRKVKKLASVFEGRLWQY